MKTIGHNVVNKGVNPNLANVSNNLCGVSDHYSEDFQFGIPFSNDVNFVGNFQRRQGYQSPLWSQNGTQREQGHVIQEQGGLQAHQYQSPQ